MTKKYSTKRALVASVLMLALCFSMLVGTTFAWFTDSVTSANNVITSGNLDIELYYKTESMTDYEKVTDSTNIFMDDALWEPGHTEVVKLKIANEGSLALKYQLSVNVVSETGSVNVNEEEFKLSDFIKYGIVDGEKSYTRDEAVSAVDATATPLSTPYGKGKVENLPADDAATTEKENEEYITMVVYMPTDVGNDANAKTGEAVPTINLGLNLVATQLASESDSFDNTYDKDTWVKVYTAEELQAAINAGETTITIMDDMVLNGSIVIPAAPATYAMRAAANAVTINLNGNTITANLAKSAGPVIENNGNLIINGDENSKIENTAVNGSSVIKNNGTLVINGGTYIGAPSDISVGTASYAINTEGNGASLTLNNVVVEGRGAIGATKGAEVEINGGTYHTPKVAWGHAVYADGEGTLVTINDGTFSEGYEMAPDNWGMYQIYSGNKAKVVVYGGTFPEWDCANGVDLYTANEGTIEIYGGTFAFAPADEYVGEGTEMAPKDDGTIGVVVAKIGSTNYFTIDEAIAAWTNGKTLTLASDVTLSDVITIKSTEYHILDLGIYTMTAAEKKDAIQIENNGRSSASYTLDIKADANNPGGITATGKAIVRTAGKSGVKDRPIIRFYNGVFNASYIVYHTGSNGTNCPQFQFHGGVYNGNITTNRTLNQFYGGTFNGSLMMSVDSSAYTLIVGGTFKNLSNLYGSALNKDKFTIGSAKGVFDREVYVDDNGYFVVATSAPSQGIEAVVSKNPGSYDYLAYSKVKTDGVLNYTDAKVAFTKNNSTSSKITVYVDELDMTDVSYKGAIVVEDDIVITFAEGTTPTWKVVDAAGNEVTYTENIVNGVVTRTYTLA